MAKSTKRTRKAARKAMTRVRVPRVTKAEREERALQVVISPMANALCNAYVDGARDANRNEIKSFPDLVEWALKKARGVEVQL